MQTTLVAAACQMCSGLDKAANLRTAERLTRQAAAAGAGLVVLPELFNCLGPFPDVVAQAEPIPGPSSERMGALAAELGITLVAGSVCEAATPGQPGPAPSRDQDSGGPGPQGYNTALLFGPDGRLLARYRKMHLFDVHLPGGPIVRESSFIGPGDHTACVAAPPAALGLAICYDLRFPELFRRLVEAGMEVLAFPSAFTQTTGRHHWHALLRARAIENQCYVVAANQFGWHSAQLTSFGHSLLIDPWGAVLAEGPGDAECVLTAEFTAHRLAEVRGKLPALRHRRLLT